MPEHRRVLARRIRNALQGENLVIGFRTPGHRPTLCIRVGEGSDWQVSYHCGCTGLPDRDTGITLPIDCPAPDYTDFRAFDGCFDHEGATEYEMRLSRSHLERHLDRWLDRIMAEITRPQAAVSLLRRAA